MALKSKSALVSRLRSTSLGREERENGNHTMDLRQVWPRSQQELAVRVIVPSRVRVFQAEICWHFFVEPQPEIMDLVDLVVVFGAWTVLFQLHHLDEWLYEVEGSELLRDWRWRISLFVPRHEWRLPTVLGQGRIHRERRWSLRWGLARVDDIDSTR